MNTGALPLSAAWLAQNAEALDERARGGEIDAYPAKRARLVDRYFEGRLEELRETESLRASSFALVAVGGYGRSELCPGSDIDVLVLFAKRVPETVQELSEGLFHPLWDLGLDLGHGVRTISDCMSLAREDYQVLASLLDARLLAGDREVFDRFLEVFAKKIAKGKSKRFLKWLDEQNEARALEFGDSSELLEPDLKRGLGALRGYHQIGWLTQLLQAGGGFSHPFTTGERHRLAEDYTVVLSARTALHLVAGRRTNTLHFDLQPKVADLLGFSSPDDSPWERALGVERFLSSLHEAMASIKTMRRVFWLECFSGKGGISPVAEGVVDTPRGLDLSDGRAVELDPLRALNLFQAQADTGRPLSLAAFRHVRRGRKRWTDDLRDRPETLAALLDILKGVHSTEAASTLMETGLLGALLPEFSEVEHLVQFDDYHLHPVGPHTLKGVGLLAGFLRGEGEPDPDIAARMEDQDILLLAGLFHDLGKGRGEHCTAGADIARKVLARHGVSADRAEEVALLVLHHLLLPTVATRKDLSDENEVARVAQTAGTPQRLDMLYLLTVADATATGPRAWNSWSAALVSELYRKARKLLVRGDLASPDVKQRMEATTRRVLELAEVNRNREFAETCLAKMPARALQSQSPEDVAAQIGLAAKLAVEAWKKPSASAANVAVVDAGPAKVEGANRVTVVTKDRPGLFAILAGVMTLHQLDILSADLFTWKDGTVVDVFTVGEPPDSLFPEEVFKRVDRAVNYALAGKLSLQYQLSKMRASPLHAGTGPQLPPEVAVDNDSSDFYTIVEVAAPDRLGLLHDVARVLADMYIQVHLAKITTNEGRVADVFYVRDSGGRRLDDPGLVEEVKRELLKRV